jgi:hypothetical protein
MCTCMTCAVHAHVHVTQDDTHYIQSYRRLAPHSHTPFTPTLTLTPGAAVRRGGTLRGGQADAHIL